MFTPAFVIFQPFRGNFNSNQDIIYGKLGNINNKKPVNKQDLTGFNRISGLDILLKIEWKRRNTTSTEQLKKNQSRNSSKINRTVQNCLFLLNFSIIHIFFIFSVVWITWNLTTHFLASISHFSYLVLYIGLINVVIVQRINVNIKSFESLFTSFLSLLSHLVLYKRQFLLACQS